MQQVSTKTYSRPSKLLIFYHVLRLPVRVDYGHSLSVSLLLIKSPNFVIVQHCACWLPWGKKPPTTHSCSVTGDEGQLPSKIDGLVLSCW